MNVEPYVVETVRRLGDGKHRAEVTERVTGNVVFATGWHVPQAAAEQEAWDWVQQQRAMTGAAAGE